MNEDVDAWFNEKNVFEKEDISKLKKIKKSDISNVDASSHETTESNQNQFEWRVEISIQLK